MQHPNAPKHVSPTHTRVLELVAAGDVKVSAQGYDDLSSASIPIRELIGAIAGATLLEDYPLYPKGPCILMLQHDPDRRPVHVVWGIPKGHTRPAVLITAYRPDDDRWDEGFTRRSTSGSR